MNSSDQPIPPKPEDFAESEGTSTRGTVGGGLSGVLIGNAEATAAGPVGLIPATSEHGNLEMVVRKPEYRPIRVRLIRDE